MEILEPHGKRFEIALKLFHSGEPLSFRGVSLALAPEGYLVARVSTSWHLENTTERTALSDFQVAESTLNDLFAGVGERLSCRWGRSITACTRPRIARLSSARLVS